MLFTRGSEHYAGRLALAFLVFVRLGEASLEDEIERSKVVKMSGNVKSGRVRSFSRMKPTELALSDVILKKMASGCGIGIDVGTRSEFETHYSG
jgi:hypothetical protein